MAQAQGQRTQGQEGSSSQPDDPRSFLKDELLELDSGPWPVHKGNGCSGTRGQFIRQPDDPVEALKDGAFELDRGPLAVGLGSGLSTGKRFFLLFSSTHHSAWHTSGF